MGQLEGTVVLVTETAVGIGGAIAEPCGREAATLVVSYSKSWTEAEARAQFVTQAGGGAVPLRADAVRDREVRAMAAQTPEHCGRIDLLVNNAGIPVWRPAATS